MNITLFIKLAVSDFFKNVVAPESAIKLPRIKLKIVKNIGFILFRLLIQLKLNWNWVLFRNSCREYQFIFWRPRSISYDLLYPSHPPWVSYVTWLAYIQQCEVNRQVETFVGVFITFIFTEESSHQISNGKFLIPLECFYDVKDSKQFNQLNMNFSTAHNISNLLMDFFLFMPITSQQSHLIFFSFGILVQFLLYQAIDLYGECCLSLINSSTISKPCSKQMKIANSRSLKGDSKFYMKLFALIAVEW